MAILINRKTGKEFQTSDPEMVLEKYPNTFKVKPGTKLAKEIEVKETEVVTATEVKPKKNKSKTKTSDKKE